jgi:hypothetical protein
LLDGTAPPTSGPAEQTAAAYMKVFEVCEMYQF